MQNNVHKTVSKAYIYKTVEHHMSSCTHETIKYFNVHFETSEEQKSITLGENEIKK